MNFKLLLLLIVIPFLQFGCQKTVPPSERAEQILYRRPKELDQKFVEKFELKINGQDAFGTEASCNQGEAANFIGSFKLKSDELTEWHYARVFMRPQIIEDGKADWSQDDSSYNEIQVTSLLAKEIQTSIENPNQRLSLAPGDYETRFYLIVQRQTPEGKSVFEGSYLIESGQLKVTPKTEPGSEGPGDSPASQVK